MVAADRDGLLPNDPILLQKVCHLDTIPDVKSFIDKGFLDNQISTRKQPKVNQPSTKNQPRLEESRVEEKREEKTEKKADYAATEKVILEWWNGLAEKYSLPKCISFTDKRKAALKERIQDPVFLRGWKEAMKKIPESEFLLGKNDRGWKADMEFFLRPDTVVKILEGKYSGTTTPKEPSFQEKKEQERKAAEDAHYNWAEWKY
jgi:hypothetical protein